MVDQRSPEQSGETRKYQKGIKQMQKGSCQNGSRVGVLGYHRDGVQGLAHRGTGKEILKEITPAKYIYIQTLPWVPKHQCSKFQLHGSGGGPEYFWLE